MKKKKATRYYQPTPVIMRKLGDSLLSVSATITTYAIADDAKSLAFAALWVGVGGKFLTNLFKEDVPVDVIPDVGKHGPVQKDDSINQL